MGERTDAPACPECGELVGADANFCSYCGVELRGLPDYCRKCGDRFDQGEAFCSNCGTARVSAEERERRQRGQRANVASSGASPAHAPDRDESDRDEFRRRVEGHLARGWTIEHDYGDRVVLVDRDVGSIGVHVLLLVFTGGVGNLIYAWYRYTTGAKRRYLAADEADEAAVERELRSRRSDDEMAVVVAIGAYLLGAFLAFVGAALALSEGAPGVVVGLPLLIAGLLLMPAVHRRIGRFRGITRFGSVKSTDERTFRGRSETCVVCGERTDRGLERRYVQERVVAGIPLYTEREGRNYYCPDCALSEVYNRSDASGIDDLDAAIDGDADPSGDAIDRELERDRESERDAG